MTTYRNPRFILDHLAAEASITTPFPTVNGRGVERLTDYRLGPPMEWTNAEATHFIDIDLGTPKIADAVLVPAGSNIGGDSIGIVVFSGDTYPATDLQGFHVDTISGTPLLAEFEPVQARYWRIGVVGSGAWQIPELILGSVVEPERGFNPEWEVSRLSTVSVVDFPAFEATNTLAPARSRWVLEQRATTSGDLHLWDQLREVGQTRPIAFLPPDDSFDWGIYRLQEDPISTQAHPIPSLRLQYTSTAILVEQL